MTRPPTAGERQRLRTVIGLWRALIPLLVVVGVIVVFTWPRGTQSDGVHVVDTAGPLAAARQSSGFEVPAPSGLAPTWRANSTETQTATPDHGASFRIGYVTPDNNYAEYLASNDAAAAVTAQYGPLSLDGKQQIAGHDWAKLLTQKGRYVLTRTAGPVTVVVTGSASLDELTQLASSLTEASGSPF